MSDNTTIENNTTNDNTQVPGQDTQTPKKIKIQQIIDKSIEKSVDKMTASILTRLEKGALVNKFSLTISVSFPAVILVGSHYVSHAFEG